MKFTLRKASDLMGKNPREIEINTLEELIELVKKEECAVIVEFDADTKEVTELTVYDYWIE